ncbi:hypothetical protein F5Y15DRAFT_392719 [Xylariaceae sp. FL0016]|nr:hypothetical protein F5Y15DRAFT_392719 [Xylariaceae sp. FL0016]
MDAGAGPDTPPNDTSGGVLTGGAPVQNGTAVQPGTGMDTTPIYLMPAGLGMILLCFTVFLFFASMVVVVLRTWLRARNRTFGVDDGLMLVGLALFLSDAGIVCYDTFCGLGQTDSHIADQTQQTGIKFVMIWQLFYITSLLFIKASICTTLLRIAVKKTHRIALYVTIGVSIVMTLAGFIGTVTICRPLRATWTPDVGVCPREVLVSLNYMISAGAIVTDWACAVIPMFILWNAQMKRKVKISICVVLALGSIASASTFARLPYIQYYNHNDNFLFHVGNMVLWSVIEGGIGLVAGSLPMLRVYFKRWIGHSEKATTGPTGGLREWNLGGYGPTTNQRGRTFSSASRANRSNLHSTKTKTNGGKREWERLDEESMWSQQKEGILVEQTVDLEFEMEGLKESKLGGEIVKPDPIHDAMKNKI